LKEADLLRTTYRLHDHDHHARPRPKAEGDGPKGRDEMPKRHFVATIVVAKNVDRIETKIYRTKLHAGGVAGHSNKKPGFKAGLL
jgi:hypothetical protein